MSPQKSNMVRVIVIMVSSLVLILMSESAVINDVSNQPIKLSNIIVDLKECYKVWGDDCKSKLYDAICNGREFHRDICCYPIATEKIKEDCYFSIADDLRTNYPCKTPELALPFAFDNWRSCNFD